MIMSIFSLGFRFCERHSERTKRPDCYVGTQAPNVLLQDCGRSFGCSSGPGRKTETSATDKGRVSATTGQLHQSVALSLPPHFGQTLPAHRTGRCLLPNIPTSLRKDLLGEVHCEDQTPSPQNMCQALLPSDVYVPKTAEHQTSGFSL